MKFILIFSMLCLPVFAQDDIRYFNDLKKALHNKNPEVRLKTIERLKELGLKPWLIGRKEKEYFSLLAMAFQDEDNAVASRAAHIFKLLVGETAPEFLLPLLDSKKPSARYLSTEVLGSLKCIEAKQKLIELLDDPDPYMQGFAALALGKMGIKEALSKLLKNLENKEVYRFSRIHAAEALGMLGDSKAISPLIKAAQDPDEYIRYAAAQALGNMKAKSAIPVLTSLLKDPYDETREMAKISLERISDSLVTPITEEEIPDVHFSLQVPRLIYYGRSYQCRIRIENNGNVPLTDVRIHYTSGQGIGIDRVDYKYWKDLLPRKSKIPPKNYQPRSLLYIDSSPPADIQFPEGKFSGKWQFAKILPKSSQEINAILSIRKCGLLPHIITFRANKNNNRLEISRRTDSKVVCIPAFHISTYDTEDPCVIGRQTIYVLEARNEGTTACTNVILADRLPEQMEFIETEGPTEKTYYPAKHAVVFAPFPLLQPGDKLTYRIRCKAISSGSALNYAAAQYDQFDSIIVDGEGTSVCE